MTVNLIVINVHLRLIILTLLLTSPLIIFGQNEDTDKLLIQFKSTADPDKKYELLLKLGEVYKNIDHIQSISFVNEAVEIATSLADYKKTGKAYDLKSRIYYGTGNFQQALIADSLALKNFIEANDSLNIAYSFNSMGDTYRVISEPGKAFECYLKALHIYELLGNIGKQSYVYNHIGIIYRVKGEYEKAIANFLKALELTQHAKDTLHTSKIYNNLANVYADLNQLEKALEMHHNALALRTALNKPYYISGSLLNIGGLHQRLKNYQTSLKYFSEAINISEEINDEYTLSLALYNTGYVNHLLKKYNKAVSDIYRAINLAKEQKNLSLLLECHHTLSNIFKDMNLYEDALENKTLEYSYKDSIIANENSQKLLELQTKFETTQKEKEIELLQKEKEIATLTRNLLIFGLALTTIILILLYLMYKIRINKNKEILNQQKKIYEKEQQLINSELEKKQMKEMQLEKELELKSKQLTVHALNILQKNKLLEQLQHNLHEIKSSNGKSNLEYSSVNQLINHSLNIDKDWDEFSQHFDQINTDFFKRLKNDFPDLSPSDLRLAALIKINMNIKEAANVLNISPGSVKTARYRLRKKLNLANEDDLNLFVISY